MKSRPPGARNRVELYDISNNADVKLSNLDSLELPEPALNDEVQAAPAEIVRDGSNVLATALEDASRLAITEAIEILRTFADPTDDKIFGIVVRAKCAVIGHVFNAKLRVSEESFRQQRFDRLPELLRLIADEEKRLPARLLVEAS